MNFKKRQEQEARRKGLFESGLQKFNQKDVEGVRFSLLPPSSCSLGCPGFILESRNVLRFDKRLPPTVQVDIGYGVLHSFDDVCTASTTTFFD